MRKFCLSTSVLALLSAVVASACWTGVDKVEYAEDSPVIVVGEVVSVAGIVSQYKGGSHSLDEIYDVSDRASIQVTQVIRNALSGVAIAAGDTVVANIAPIRRGISVSIDIRYKVGDEGVWLMRVTRKGELSLQSHPAQHWSTEDLDQITHRIPKWKNERQLSNTAWIRKHGAARR